MACQDTSALEICALMLSLTPRQRCWPDDVVACYKGTIWQSLMQLEFQCAFLQKKYCNFFLTFSSFLLLNLFFCVLLALHLWLFLLCLFCTVDNFVSKIIFLNLSVFLPILVRVLYLISIQYTHTHTSRHSGTHERMMSTRKSTNNLHLFYFILYFFIFELLGIFFSPFRNHQQQYGSI